MSKELNWKGHIRSQRSSGLSMAEYCRQKGLNLQVFYRWQSKAKREDLSEATAPDFLEIKPSKSETPSNIIEIEFPTGMKVRSQEWPPSELLRSYIEVLR